MKDEHKTKKQLAEELKELRGRLGKLEAGEKDSSGFSERRRKEAEMALEKSERQYRTLVDNAMVGVYRTSLRGEILYVNSALAGMFGFESPEEMMSESVLARYEDPKDRERLITQLRETGKVRNFEVDLLTKTKGHRRVIMNGTLEGDIISGMIVDITDREKLQKQLRQAHKMEAIGTLTAGLTHECHNVMTAILGSTEHLKEGIPKNRKLMKYIDVIETSVERVLNLTNSLQAYCRKQIMRRQSVDVNAAIRHTETFFESLIPEDIRLKISTSTKPLTIDADMEQIEQAFVNVASNATEAMPSGGTLKVTSEPAEFKNDLIKRQVHIKRGKYALVTVKDTGRGMGSKTLERIFEPFFTTKDVGEGIGLGLSMTYGVIKRHGGHITVESKPRKGTTFKIYLPLSR
jgi:PAS domain S-box-containing protein